MTERQSHRGSLFATALIVGSALALGPALAEGNPVPAPPQAPQSSAPGPAKSTPKAKKKKQQRTEQEFRDGYRYAYNLIQAGQYDVAIAALQALDEDDHPDVANYIGFASRKLGRYDDAKVWYERALASDPNHTRTWQYYGMWHVEQGNMLKAQDHLEKIQVLCGTGCKEYTDLKGAMEGTVVY